MYSFSPSFFLTKITMQLLQELSYDYGYRLDSVTGADGNIVKLACHCGASDCRKWLY
jgi:euchromatic histone-lysine N-methyltransferase